MKNVLLVNSSPKVDAYSRQLTNTFMQTWQKKFPTDQVMVRDVGMHPIPHLLDESVEGIVVPTPTTEVGKQTRNLSDTLIAEMKAADVIVFGVPMHNFTIPSSLKAYFDHIARYGVTWGNGIEFGKGKQVVAITTGGGSHQDTERDFQRPYLEWFFKFIGFKEVNFIRAHELFLGNAVEIIAKAENEIKQYIAKIPTPTFHNSESHRHILACLPGSNKPLNKGEITIRLANVNDISQDQIQHLCRMINNAYDNAETGMWKVKSHRANQELLIPLIKNSELLLAEINNTVVGCTYIKFIDAKSAEFGMLAVDGNYRNLGIGTQLIQSAEKRAAENNRVTMQLKLLMPHEGKHESKEFLNNWYSRLGYEILSREPFEKIEPHKLDMLAITCDFVSFSKNLNGLRLSNSNLSKAKSDTDFIESSIKEKANVRSDMDFSM